MLRTLFVKDFNMRGVASMVAEVLRILTRCRVFMYPVDAKCRAQGGSLRLMCEANPMAFIVEQAGGASTDGNARILDRQSRGLDERAPVFLASKNQVALVTSDHA